MYILGIIILVFFAIIGIANFITAITQKMYRGDHCQIVICDVSEENAEMQLRCALCAQQVTGGRIICLCDDEDNVKRICERICGEHSCTKVMSKAEFMSEMSSLP